MTIAARFSGGTGRYMYHCHVLEHEDHEMMRPFVVLPDPVKKQMHMSGMPVMPGMNGNGSGSQGAHASG